MDSQLYASYLQVIAEVPNFVTDSSAQAGNRGTYKYLSLSTLLQRIKPVFAQHGIMFRQEVVNTPSDAGKMQLGEVRTIVFDGGGNDIQVGAYPFVVSADPQAIGSAVTYARRYSLYAALGIFPEKDDDGAAARAYSTQPHDNGDAEAITRMDADALLQLAQQRSIDLQQFASQTLGRQLNRLSDIRRSELPKLSQALGGAR